MTCERCKCEDTDACKKCSEKSAESIARKCKDYCKECENKAKCERVRANDIKRNQKLYL